VAARIFLNYRRSDAEAWADRLYERLAAQLPDVEVFMDIDGKLPLGLSWAEELDRWVATCNLMLVLIGRTWSSEFQARSGPGMHDYVRAEIESALARKIPVVPVLLGDTPVPTHDDLPAAIRPLLELQAARLQRATFDIDTKALAEGIARSIALSRDKPMTAVQAIAGAAAAEEGVSGLFAVLIRKTGSSEGVVWLMSEDDYRDPRCLSIAVHDKARIALTKLHGKAPTVFFRGQTVLVRGTAKKKRIDFIADGKPTGHYYFQTHVDVTDAGQVTLAAAGAAL
jgi:TIR domain